jgi:hypothetical protein
LTMGGFGFGSGSLSGTAGVVLPQLVSVQAARRVQSVRMIFRII